VGAGAGAAAPAFSLREKGLRKRLPPVAMTHSLLSQDRISRGGMLRRYRTAHKEPRRMSHHGNWTGPLPMSTFRP
jgi:hypothetical protein